VLTQISLFWFDFLRDVIPNHVLSADTADLPDEYAAYADSLAGRMMLVKKAQVFPVECIVRGYLAGSGWKEYREHGTVCGIALPEGMVESQQLPEPLFTPSTKAVAGSHDENITFARMAEIVGREYAERLRDASLELYSRAAEHARSRGIIIADTKFEFGMVDCKVTLIDEVLTPDSSRFWPAESYEPGHGQPSYDKQFVRDWLEASGWDKKPPAPSLPEDVIVITAEKYVEPTRPSPASRSSRRVSDMSRRSPMNPRYGKDAKVGSTRRSASSVKPKREAGEVTSSKPTPSKAKDDAKTRPSWREAVPTSPEIKQWRTIWWVLFGLMIVTWATVQFVPGLRGDPQAESIGMGVLTAAFFGTMYIEFGKIRRLRKELLEQAQSSKKKKGAS